MKINISLQPPLSFICCVFITTIILMHEELFKDLLSRYLTGNLLHSQKIQLTELLNKEEYQQRLELKMEEDFITDKYLVDGNGAIRDAIQNFLSQKIGKEIKIRRNLINIKRMAAAASIILLLCTASWLIFRTSNSTKPPIASSGNLVIKDLPPGRTGAILTLANGSKIILDSTHGSLGMQGSSKVVNNNGVLSYADGKNSTEIFFNVMSTPVGRQYQLILSDGSKVWLNAASSITYPTVFSSSERKVQITGEAYFEVMRNKSQPFHVSVNGLDVEVLGTHFNINTYNNEPSIKTTLLEGSIKVTKGTSSILVARGEQAITENASDELSKKSDVDVDQVIAWKNGKFVFQDAEIKSIMRQLERWYGVTAVFSENVTTEEFDGVISRNVNLSQILNLLTKTGSVNFSIEGSTIVVK